MRSAIHRSVLLALVALGGCIDYVPMQPEPEGPQLSGSAMMLLSVRHAARADLLYVEGSLYTGVGPRGQPRTVSDDRLRVGDGVLAPVQRERGWLAYAGSVAGGGPETGAVRITPPTVEGTRDAPGTWTVTRTMRDGGEEVPVLRGSDPVLRLRSGGATPVPTDRGWALFLTSQAGSASIQRQGAVPDTIRIPAELLPGAGADTIHALLRVTLGMDRGHDLDYAVGISFTSELTWTLVPASP